MAQHHFDHKQFLVPVGKKFKLRDRDPRDTTGIKNKAEAEASLTADVARLSDAQNLLWASAQASVICIFQAMDAAGKDGTIKHVMSGVNPQGVEVYSFKAPTEEERLRPFLWRPLRILPARGRMAIFNRSYYEEVLVVRVHPEFLNGQALPSELLKQGYDAVWDRRYAEINTFEKWLVDNRTLVLKFYLHVSKDEQRKRFLERIDDPEKNWKFNSGDIRERGHWDEYMAAYEAMFQATSTEHAPWYVIPADKKWYTRSVVADIIATRIEELKLSYPEISADEKAKLSTAREQLLSE
jgi:PPK2 family polyphosphate:nucleotide phosphotransferase